MTSFGSFSGRVRGRAVYRIEQFVEVSSKKKNKFTIQPKLISTHQNQYVDTREGKVIRKGC